MYAITTAGAACFLSLHCRPAADGLVGRDQFIHYMHDVDIQLSLRITASPVLFIDAG